MTAPALDARPAAVQPLIAVVLDRAHARFFEVTPTANGTRARKV